MKTSCVRATAIRLCLISAGLFIAIPSGATPTFPAVVQEFVGSAHTPACTICHNNPNGGLGTATTQFATYLRAHGLIAHDENSMRAALTADQAERHDSDGDGVPDIEALKQELDPNGTVAEEPPGYGCALDRSARTQRRTGKAFTITCALLVCGVARRRRYGFHRPSVLLTLACMVGFLAGIAWHRRGNATFSPAASPARISDSGPQQR